MPYIKQADRQAFDDAILALTQKIETPGDLNYVITRIVTGSLRTVNYAVVNAAIGTLECAKLELYRRLVAPYEDKKIAENGDIKEYEPRD